MVCACSVCGCGTASSSVCGQWSRSVVPYVRVHRGLSTLVTRLHIMHPRHAAHDLGPGIRHAAGARTGQRQDRTPGAHSLTATRHRQREVIERSRGSLASRVSLSGAAEYTRQDTLVDPRDQPRGGGSRPAPSIPLLLPPPLFSVGPSVGERSSMRGESCRRAPLLGRLRPRSARARSSRLGARPKPRPSG